MRRTTGDVPPVGPEGPVPEAWRRRPLPSRTTVWVLGALTPILASILTRFDFVQNADGWFVRGLIWDIGRIRERP